MKELASNFTYIQKGVTSSSVTSPVIDEVIQTDLKYLYLSFLSVCIFHHCTVVNSVRGTKIPFSSINMTCFLRQATRWFNTEAVNQAGRHPSRAVQAAHTWDDLSWTALHAAHTASFLVLSLVHEVGQDKLHG